MPLLEGIYLDGGTRKISMAFTWFPGHGDRCGRRVSFLF